MGQYQVGSGGHANDASNRVGSGGFNGVSPAAVRAANDNNVDIWTGNVSGLNYFHGNTNNTFDSNTLQINTENESDLLLRAAAPANSAALRLNGTASYVPYYNTSQAVSSIPPVNFVTTPGGTGYVPAPVIAPLTPSDDSRVPNSPIPNQTDLLPSPGEVDMAGPVDPSGVQSLYTMSPLYGIRKNESDDPQASFFLSQYSNYRQTTPAERSHLDSTAVQRMQDELNNTSISGDASTNGTNTAAAVPGAANLSAGLQLQSTPLSTNQLPSDSLSNAVGGASAPFDGSLISGQGTQNHMLIPASKQSRQLADLEKKFAGKKLTDTQAASEYNQERQLLEQQDKAKAAATNGPLNGTDTNTKPGIPGSLNHPLAPADLGGSAPKSIKPTAPQVTRPPVLNGQESAANNQPYVITSLATGIKAKGLADLLKTAEDQMRSGNFSQAIDTYDSAEEVAPNNPFVPLGRGFAELGRSYYAKADKDLTRAVAGDPAILVGQYDLKGFIGSDRLKFIQKDLADISKSEKSARSVVLQAFIAHNTGDDESAVKDLDDAAARGGYAAMVKTMRDAWGLPVK